MQIKKLEIGNFKKFDHYSLELHPHFTLLVGDNGSGKTTLLDALAIASAVWLVKAPDSSLSNSGRNILPQEIRLEASSEGDRIQFSERKPVSIEADGMIADKKFEWTRKINETGSRTSNKDAEAAIKYIQKLYKRDFNGEQIIMPIMAYYGAGRAWLPSAKRAPKVKSLQRAKRWDAFYDCFEERIRIAELHGWFQNEALAALNRSGQMRPGFFAVKWALLKCIPEATDLWYDPDRTEIVLKMDGNSTPFSNLSSGQKMMVALIADIAIKAVTQNAWLLPENGDPTENEEAPEVFNNTPGVILIDEIDVHLHPKWQRRVVSDLKETFPNLQFVCTTHSPFIIQSIQPGELVILDKSVDRPVEYSNQSIEDIAEDIQQVETPQQSQKAVELAQATEAYFRLLQQGSSVNQAELTEAEIAYRRAAESFSETPGLSAILKLEAMAQKSKNNQ